MTLDPRSFKDPLNITVKQYIEIYTTPTKAQIEAVQATKLKGSEWSDFKDSLIQYLKSSSQNKWFSLADGTYRPFIDVEDLQYAGDLCSGLAFPNIETVLLDFTRENMTIEVIETTASFLTRFWKNKNEFNEELCECLLNCIKEIPKESNAYVSVLYALDLIGKGAKVSETVKIELEKALLEELQYMERSGLHRNIDLPNQLSKRKKER